MDMEERHIVTIDLGTSKTALTVAGINGDNIQILYYKKVPSHGMKYSYVLNSGKESDVVRSLVEDAENVEQCGLARARRAHDGDELALPDVEVYALEHVERLRAVVGLVDVF